MKKPNILLLGDSIRYSYQTAVADQLKDRVQVVGPEENCQYTAFTLDHLQEWLDRFGQPNLIHWNNGLHDVGHNPNRTPVQIPLENYLLNLKLILTILQKTKAAIIWATMTPVHSRRPFMDTDWSWRNTEIDLYNAAATTFMKSERIPINDLHALVQSRIDEYIVEDGVHLSPVGIEACAQAVVSIIERALP
jgi:lysophospholipase L1-like esterase